MSLICDALSGLGFNTGFCRNEKEEKQETKVAYQEDPEARSFLEKLLWGTAVGGAVGCESAPVDEAVKSEKELLAERGYTEENINKCIKGLGEEGTRRQISIYVLVKMSIQDATPSNLKEKIIADLGSSLTDDNCKAQEGAALVIRNLAEYGLPLEVKSKIGKGILKAGESDIPILLKEKIIPLLLSALNNPNDNIRAEVTGALSYFASSNLSQEIKIGMIDPILLKVKDKIEIVRMAVVNALGDLGRLEISPELRAKIKHALIEAKKDESSNVRMAASISLLGIELKESSGR